MKRFVPLAIFILLAGTLAWSLMRDDNRYVPSALVGKAMPPLDAAAVLPGKPGVQLPGGGGVRLLNIFASWCVPCIGEAPVLGQLARSGVPIDGIALRDTPAAVAEFLKEHGDPYARIGADPEGRAQIALGASGVPETFVVDGRGTIRYHHVGPIEAADVSRILTEVSAAR